MNQFTRQCLVNYKYQNLNLVGRIIKCLSGLKTRKKAFYEIEAIQNNWSLRKLNSEDSICLPNIKLSFWSSANAEYLPLQIHLLQFGILVLNKSQLPLF